MEESLNWLEIPDEVIICKDPAMWKAIHIKKTLYDSISFGDNEILSEMKVDLSRAESIDILIEGLGEKPLFTYHVRRSQKQKHIAITRCYDITDSPLSQAVEGRAQASELKELNLLHFSNLDIGDIEAIERNCPHLTSLSIISRWSLQGSFRLVVVNDDHALAITKNMPDLRHLGLFGSGITSNGLEAVIYELH
ncbi:hypothetical protein LXL04_027561 [Taraxacum kok-saghyz]